MTATLTSPGTEQLCRETLKRLLPLRTDRPVVLTLYLRLEGNDRIRNGYRLTVREAIHRLVASGAYTTRPNSERAGIDRDLERITAHLDIVSGLPHTPGLVIVACDARGVFEVIPLPHVLQTRLLTATRPHLAEARAALDDFRRIVVAAVDRTHARFFEVDAFACHELPGLALVATRGGKFHSDRADAPGMGERDFHNRIREERHRRAAAVARQLTRLAAEAPCQGIVLAGPLRTTREMVRFLPRQLATMLFGVLPLNPTAVSPAEIREAALTLRAEHLRSQEARLLQDLTDAIGTGWAVKGLRPALTALGQGQVRTLVVPAGQVVSGVRCVQSGRLAASVAECQDEGGVVPVPDLIGEALEEALDQEVEVVVLEDLRLAARVDRMAAFLRFR